MEPQMEIKTIVTSDFEMDYATFGSGPRNLAIIPGLSLRGVLESASTIEAAYKIFKADYTVYLFERKKDADLGYSIPQMASDTATALKAMGVEHVDVFGASQGGMVGQYMAIRFPEMVDHLVLASSTSRAEPLQVEVIEHWADLADVRQSADLVNDFIEKAFSQKFLERYRRALQMMYRKLSESEMKRFSVMARACKFMDSFDELGKIKCPVFVIGASDDQVVTYEASVKMAEKLKAENVPCEFYTYEGYGHAVFDEASDYRERVLDFLRNH
ncbi:MAG: alpha/beta hydrolase [Fibrobacter sp.]|nr:alpha/beta hydrolase [Fibrobacter sp.]